MRLSPYPLSKWDPSICPRCYIRQLVGLRSARKAFLHSQSQRASQPLLAEKPSPTPPPQHSLYDDSSQPRKPPNPVFGKTGEPNLPIERPSFEPKLDIRSRLKRWDSNIPKTKRAYPTFPWNSPHSNILSRPDADQLDQDAYLRTGIEKSENDESENSEHSAGSVNLPMADELLDSEPGIMDAPEITETARERIDRDARKAMGEYDSFDASRAALHRGDLVELYNHLSYMAVYAVYLGAADVDCYQFYTSEGSLSVRSMRDVRFAHGSFASPKELESLTPFLLQPKNIAYALGEYAAAIPRDVASHLRAKMRDFEKGIELANRQLAPKLDNITSALAHRKDIQYKTLEEITEKIATMHGMDIDPQSPEVQWAVSQMLLKETPGFHTLSSNSYWCEKYLSILPRRTLDGAQKVLSYVRAHQEERALAAIGAPVPPEIALESRKLQKFVEKARVLIAQSRELYQMSKDLEGRFSVGNTVNGRRHLGEAVRSLRFSDDDRLIISALALTSMLKGFNSHHHPIALLADMIFRAVNESGIYESSMVNKTTQRNFLVDIGVLRPHENMKPFDVDVAQQSASVSAKLSICEQRIKQGHSVEAVGEFADVFEGSRKDWKDLNVYCIDSETASEIDDGISVSQAHDSEDVTIHVHVAHISSFISRDHMLGRAAARSQSTVYAVSERVPMLPWWAAERFSLSKDKPALTFSATIDASGNIKSTQLQPSIIRKVYQVTPEYLDQMVFGEGPAGGKQSTGQQHPGVDDTSTSNIHAAKPALPTEFEQQIKLLYETLQKIDGRKGLSNISGHRYSTSMGATRVFTDVDVHYRHGTKVVSLTGLWPTRAVFDTRMPRISLRFKTVDWEAQGETGPAKIIVSHSMILAGRVAGMWAEEHKLPILYSGTQSQVDDAGLLGAKVLDRIKGSDQPDMVLRRLRQSLSTRAFSSKPIPHISLGLSHYVRVTSPLRRYTDLVAHWQIDAALRMKSEAERTGVEVRELHEVAPFKADEMEAFARRSLAHFERERMFAKDDRLFWIFQGIARAFYLNEAALPNPLLVMTRDVDNRRWYHGTLVQLGTLCRFAISRDASGRFRGDDLRAVGGGELWECQMSHVSVETRTIYVVPLRRARVRREASVRPDEEGTVEMDTGDVSLQMEEREKAGDGEERLVQAL